jgi:hypothetical protein
MPNTTPIKHGNADGHQGRGDHLALGGFGADPRSGHSRAGWCLPECQGFSRNWRRTSSTIPACGAPDRAHRQRGEEEGRGNPAEHTHQHGRVEQVTL